MTHTWDPDRYLAYADERGRPFVDLIPAIDAADARDRRRPRLRSRQPDRAACRALARRRGHRRRQQRRDDRGRASGALPRAPVRGRRPSRLVGRRERPGRRARLQRHPPVAPRPPRPAAAAGRAGAPGRLVRVPGPRQLRRAEPHDPHRACRRGAVRRPHGGRRGASSYDAATYLRALQALGCEVDAWETTYLHVLHGEDPVFTWVSGTGARPTLQALPDDLRADVRGGVQAPTAGGLPDDGHGVVLPFRRIFVVARTGAAVRLHHVQVACPPGGEDAARRFYADGLGMAEVDKPAELACARRRLVPGVRRAGAVAAEIHVGVEDPFRPARKAHPALVLSDEAELAGVGERLARSDSRSTTPARQLPGSCPLPHLRRHGNRVEIMRRLIIPECIRAPDRPVSSPDHGRRGRRRLCYVDRPLGTSLAAVVRPPARRNRGFELPAISRAVLSFGHPNTWGAELDVTRRESVANQTPEQNAYRQQASGVVRARPRGDRRLQPPGVVAHLLLTVISAAMSQVRSLWNTSVPRAAPRRWRRRQARFSIVFSQKAPYFASIRPRFTGRRPEPRGAGDPASAAACRTTSAPCMPSRCATGWRPRWERWPR